MSSRFSLILRLSYLVLLSDELKISWCRYEDWSTMPPVTSSVMVFSDTTLTSNANVSTPCTFQPILILIVEAPCRLSSTRLNSFQNLNLCISMSLVTKQLLYPFRARRHSLYLCSEPPNPYFDFRKRIVIFTFVDQSTGLVTYWSIKLIACLVDRYGGRCPVRHLLTSSGRRKVQSCRYRRIPYKNMKRIPHMASW